MQYRPLGQSGMNVSAFGLGCVTFGREIDEAMSFRVMDRALERGINLFDTAEAYAGGGSETVVGRWLRDRRARDKVILATKVGPTAGGDALPRGYSAARITAQVEGSLRRLGVDCIDLYQLHVWDASVPPEETLEALDRAVRQGKVRSIGCSNFTAWQLCRALWISDKQGWAPLQAVASKATPP